MPSPIPFALITSAKRFGGATRAAYGVARSCRCFGVVEVDRAGQMTRGVLFAAFRRDDRRAVRYAARVDDAHARIVDVPRQPRDVRRTERPRYTATAIALRPKRRFRVVGDVLADRERRRRRGRGRVAHVDDALAAFEHEVVDQRTVGCHRLRAHAGRAGESIVRRQLRDVALQCFHVRAGHEIAIHFACADLPIFRGEFEEAGIG